jgi:hypothetical protein
VARSRSPAQEQTRFDVVFRGLHVAEVTLVAEERGGTYALAGQVQSTGLARLFARVRFRMQAEGGVWRALCPGPGAMPRMWTPGAGCPRS